MKVLRLGLYALGLVTCLLALPFTAWADDCGCKDQGEWTSPDGCMTLPCKPCNWDAVCGCPKPCAEPCDEPCSKPCAKPCSTPCDKPCAKPCETKCQPDCAQPCGKCPKCSEFPQTGEPGGMHEIPLPDTLSAPINLDCCCPRGEYELLCGCGQEYTLCPLPGEYELLCQPKKPCKPCKPRCKQDTCSPDKCGHPQSEPAEWDS